MNNHRYLLEAVQLLQHHKVKKERVPIAHTLLDVTLALMVAFPFGWAIVELILWLNK